MMKTSDCLAERSYNLELKFLCSSVAAVHKKTYVGSIAYWNHEKTSMDDIVRRKEIQEAIAKIKDADIPLPAIFSDESHV